MRKPLATLLTLTVVVTTAAFVESPKPDNRAEREIALADYAIRVSLMVLANPTSQTLCTQDEYACMAGDRTELALPLIAARDTPIALLSLARLLRYRLDGGLSEDFTCYVLAKGPLIVPYLRRLDPTELDRACAAEVEEVMDQYPRKFDRLRLGYVCSDRRATVDRIQELLLALNKHSKCDAADF